MSIVMIEPYDCTITVSHVFMQVSHSIIVYMLSLIHISVLRIGVYLVDVLDEAHGDTFIADAYSGSGSKQPGFIDVKARKNNGARRDMHYELEEEEHVVYPGFTPGGFFRFCLPPLLFGQSRPGRCV